jgi:hypothetical protein
MTCTPRVQFRVLIWTACLSFSKQIFVLLLPAHSCIVFNQLSRYVNKKILYIILAKCFLMNLYEHSKSFFSKKPYISVFLKVNVVASLRIYTQTRFIVYELNALGCNLLNHVCQLFSMHIAASLFI